MPKKVSHKAKQQHIIQAAVRLVADKGIRAVSIRNLACEAEMKQSTLRNYFATYDDIMQATFRYVRERQRFRVEQLMATDEQQSSEMAVQIILQLLPLDTVRQQEVRLRLALIGFLQDAKFEEIRAVMNQDLNRLCRAALQAARAARSWPGMAQEALALRAFVDGLALVMMSDPSSFSSRRAQRLVRRYIQRLRDQAACETDESMLQCH